MIPKDWEVVCLSESTEKIGSGKTPLGGSNVYVESGILFIRSQNVYPNRLVLGDSTFITAETHEKMKGSAVRPNDVMLNITGASIGRCCVFPKELGEANVNQHVCLIRVKKQLNPTYVSYYLNSWFGQRQIYSYLTVGNREGLNFKQIGSFEIPCPKLEEQEKISKILSTWDEAIEKLEKLIEAKKLRKKGLMQQLLTGKKRFDGFDDKWQRKTLEQVSIISMGSSPKSEAYNEDSNGLPLIQGNADIKNRLTAPRIYTSHITKTCDVDDIILSVRAPVGEVAISNVNACIGRGVAALKSKKQFDRDFLYFSLLMCEKKWGRLSQGSTFEAVNSKDIKEFKIHCPNNLEEQKKIGQVLRKANNEIELLRQKRDFFILEKKGLMQQLLTGKKRVKID